MKIIHFINLTVTVLHSLILFAGTISLIFYNDELSVYAGYSHLVFGIFQVTLSLICLFFIKKMNNKSRNNLFKYYGVVAVYFLIMFISSKFNLPNEKIIIAYLVIIPMIIACYLVFTISIITNNIENN